MCGGGGDGGAGQLRLDEAMDERQMADAVRQINSIFGIVNPSNFNAAGEFTPNSGVDSNALGYEDWYNQIYTPANQPEPGRHGREGGSVPDLWNYTDRDDDEGLFSFTNRPGGGESKSAAFGDEYGEYMSGLGWTAGSGQGGGRSKRGSRGTSQHLGWRVPDIEGPYGRQDFGEGQFLGSDADLAQEAYANKIAHEGRLDTQRSDAMAFLTDRLDRIRTYDVEAVNRANRGRGASGGYDGLESQRRMLERYNDTVLDLGNRSDIMVNEARSADEQSRINLINSIRAGMDVQSASAGAANALSNNIDNAYGQAKATQLGDVFGDIRDLYQGYMYKTGRNSAPKPYATGSNTNFNSGGTYGGSIS
jgi:hypothetical protein